MESKQHAATLLALSVAAAQFALVGLIVFAGRPQWEGLASLVEVVLFAGPWLAGFVRAVSQPAISPRRP